jgi:hypothetical protein
MGAGFEERAHLVNLYNTARHLIGLGDDPSTSSIVSNAQVIEKIKQLAAGQIAASNGEHAGYVQQALAAVLPGGAQNVEASNHILSQMMIANQRQRDFNQYYNSYVNKYGTAVNVTNAFNKDVAPLYNREQQSLERMMTRRRDANGNPVGRSAAEWAAEDPRSLKWIENGYEDPATHKKSASYGVGATRYWR